MAIIDKRRITVEQMLNDGRAEGIIRIVCSEQYGCSQSAIRMDILYIKGYRQIHVGPKLKAFIKERDKFVCQYCLTQNPKNGIVEHIVPISLGGTNKNHNLVFACHSCNMKKKANVWIPNNLDEITKDAPEWKQKILESSVMR